MSVPAADGDPAPRVAPRVAAVVSVVVVVALAVAWLSPSADLGAVPPEAPRADVADTIAADNDTPEPSSWVRQDDTTTTESLDDGPTRPAPTTSVPVTIPVTTVTPSTSEPPATAPPQDPEEPAVVARPLPGPTPEEDPPAAPAPPWAASMFTTGAGLVSTDVGCTATSPPGGAALDVFFSGRVGPVIGWDYQHVYPLGGDRYLWLFQDAFIDHSGGAATLAQASFAHNVALLQEGGCFRLLHRGSASAPDPFEQGTGSDPLRNWFWPMGGELHDGRLYVFWARMVKDPYDPPVPDGLGWHPADTWIATYDPGSLARLDFRRAANSGATPIYGYAMASDATHTYLFGNTFEQNLSREGGFWARQHSATAMYLARVPRGQIFTAPEYRTSSGWSSSPADARPFLQRHWAEFPMQPRFMDGQWVATTAVNGYWGDAFTVDVANNPWGPWTTVHAGGLVPRNRDPKMNTYHALLAPWRDGLGNLVVTVSNNARDMRRDAWPHPHRYRPMAFPVGWVAAPTDPVPTTTTTTATTSTLPPSTTSTTTASTTTTVAPAPSTSISSTSPASTTSTTVPASSSTSTASSSSTSTLGGDPPNTDGTD